MAQHYRCAKCRKEFPASAVSVDHIQPVVGKVGFISWDLFIENLFCEKENLQTLCTTCHKKKTLAEKGERDKNRSKRT